MKKEKNQNKETVGAAEAARIAGFTRSRVLQLLNDGAYPGAFKNQSGYWCIPLEEAENISRQKKEWTWQKEK